MQTRQPLPGFDGYSWCTWLTWNSKMFIKISCLGIIPYVTVTLIFCCLVLANYQNIIFSVPSSFLPLRHSEQHRLVYVSCQTSPYSSLLRSHQDTIYCSSAKGGCKNRPVTTSTKHIRMIGKSLQTIQIHWTGKLPNCFNNEQNPLWQSFSKLVC